MGSFKDYDNMTEEEKAFYIAQMNAEANNMSDLDYRKHKQLLIDEFGTSGVTPGNRAGVNTAAIAAEEERKRRMALLLQEQKRMQQQQELNLASQDLFGGDFQGMNEKPLEGATDWIGDGAADLVDKLGLPPESLLALGLITRNGRVTQRGFKAVTRYGAKIPKSKYIPNKNKLENNTKNVDKSVGPQKNINQGKLKNKTATSNEAKNNMLQNLMTNMKNNKGRWGTGAVIAGSVANNQFSGVDDNNFSPVDNSNSTSWYGENADPSANYSDYLLKNGEVVPPFDKSTSKNENIIKKYGPWSYNTGKNNPHFNKAIDNATGEVVSLADIPANNTKEDDELERLMKEAEKMESRLGEGTRVDNPYKKTEDKIKPKELSWMDRLMQGVPGGSGGWDNPMYRIGELMREMDAPGSWGLDGKASNRWSTAAAAEAKAMNSAQTASNKQREAQFKRLWDEASKNPKNFALMVRGYLPDDSPWWQLWGEMSEENKESYAMALAITANEIQQDYLTEKGKLASNESVMAEAIKRTKKPTA